MTSVYSALSFPWLPVGLPLSLSHFFIHEDLVLKTGILVYKCCYFGWWTSKILALLLISALRIGGSVTGKRLRELGLFELEELGFRGVSSMHGITSDAQRGGHRRCSGNCDSKKREGKGEML